MKNKIVKTAILTALSLFATIGLFTIDIGQDGNHESRSSTKEAVVVDKSCFGYSIF